MFVIIAKQTHAISLRVSQCDYTPRASKKRSHATAACYSHSQKCRSFLRNPEVHYHDQDSTPYNTPTPPQK
jgi:hypothetical protein